jgi:hypothetical protein
MKVNGTINFYGLTAQQHPRDLLWWGRELHRIAPARIVALGVGFGGNGHIRIYRPALQKLTQ